MDICHRLLEDSGALVACCPVQPGLERSLTPEESDSLGASILAVRNQAAAARIAARELLSKEGFPDWSLPRRRGLGPDWPPGWIGSISHSAQFGVAALGGCTIVQGIGIDIEPAEPLPEELRDTVVLTGDIAPAGLCEIADRILFCAKEAAYKAVHPVDGRFLEFGDVTVNFDTGIADISYGRRLTLSLHVDHRIVVLARLGVNDQ